MNEKAYAKAVARRLACSKARRDEFVRDLESDIASSLADGETWEQVERRLGDPRDVAREFNEALSERELAAGRKRRRLRIAGIAAAAAVVVVAVLAAGSWWALPKTAPAGQGIGLTEQEILDLGVERREISVGFELGDTVKVIDGPLEGFLGTVDEIDPEGNSVRLIVSMFGRETPIDLELDQVEPVKEE